MATEGSVISLICIKSKYLMKWPGLWQKEIVREKKAHIEKEGDCTDTLIILQHPSVYTLEHRFARKHQIVVGKSLKNSESMGHSNRVIEKRKHKNEKRHTEFSQTKF
ncbi:hypothetical protein AAZX31_08G303100 [Glycine max]